MVYSAALASKERGDDSLDYISGQKNSCYTVFGSELSIDEMERVRLAHLKFKNAVMYYISRNRKDRRIPKLRDMLESVINEKQKE